MEVIPFQQEILSISDDSMVTPSSMKKMLAVFANNLSLKLIGLFAAVIASTKTTQTKSCLYVTFILLPYVMRQNLKP